MPVKRVKNMSKCIRQWTLKATERPYYWHVYLWEDTDALYANVGSDVADNRSPNHTCNACHCAVPTLVDQDTLQLVPDPKLGELHFIKGKWDMEVVAHELLHAMFHKLNTLCICPKEVSEDIDKQEPVCYEFGRWANDLYRKLWGADPNPKWEKEPADECKKERESEVEYVRSGCGWT